MEKDNFSQVIARSPQATKQSPSWRLLRSLRSLAMTCNFFHLLFSIFYFLPNTANADVKDVKPPVSIPGSPWLLWVFVLALAVVIYFLFRYWQRNKIKFVKPIIPKEPWELAYQRLQDLKHRDLFVQGKTKEYFIELSGIARQYIEQRFDIHAPEMTTEEFLNSVKTTPLIEAKHQEILKSFLVLCDMVKFAKYGPDIDEAGKSFELVKQFVDETKEGRMAIGDGRLENNI